MPRLDNRFAIKLPPGYISWEQFEANQQLIPENALTWYATRTKQ
jgi:hypothetical protein